MDVGQGFVTMHVVDGIVMSPTHCAYENCEMNFSMLEVGHFVLFMNMSMETSVELLLATKIELLQLWLANNTKMNGRSIFRIVALVL